MLPIIDPMSFFSSPFVSVKFTHGLTIIDASREIFFFIGSILGILAFVQTFFKPALDSNRGRWMEVQEHANDDDFREVQFGTWGRAVNGFHFGRIQTLVHDINEDAEYLRFGPLLRKSYEKVLAELVASYGSYAELVQVPAWQPSGSDPPLDWAFNKSAFIGDQGYPTDYADHLADATDRAARMRTVYKKLALLSDLHIWEIPFALTRVNRRVKETSEDF